jgi:Xaa-Pro aminopeptidase
MIHARARKRSLAFTLLLPVIVTLLHLISGASVARASDLSDDLAARRGRVMQRLPPNAMLILWSAPTRTYSLDVDYEYRQDSNLYYLTGLTQEETVLVLMPGSPSPREFLFVKESDPTKEHWYGRVLTAAEASAITGIHTVMPRSQLESFVDAALARHEASQVALLLDLPPAGTTGTAATAPTAATPTTTGTTEPVDTRATEFARRLKDRLPTVQTADAAPIFADLRTIKTPYERKVLVTCLDISSDAQKVGMRAARPGAYEYQVKAAIEGAYRARGAVSWAYPSIVGSGPNATILHYPDSDRQMQAGDLLLVYAAANYQYMAGDITRTYPVSGRYTPAQKDIYAIVLQAQDEATQAARPGSSLAAIHNKTIEVIKAGLLRLGLITDARGDQYKMWYTHSSTHYIGIDVHDVGDRNRTLEAGMAFTIEPGIYIRQSALDALPHTPENEALIQRLQPAVTRYLNIGVRVEDSFLLEESGLRRLSAAVPRTIDDIEAFLRRKSG